MNHPRKHKRTDKVMKDLSAKVYHIDQWSTFAHKEHHRALLCKVLRKGYYDLALQLLKRVHQIDERDTDSGGVYARYLTEMYIHPRNYKQKVNQDIIINSIEYIELHYPELNNEVQTLKNLIK